MRRADLGEGNVSPFAESIADSITPVIPYQIPVQKESAGDISGTFASTLPMAAMFTRNKYVGWYGDSGNTGCR